MAIASLILAPGTMLGGYRVDDVIGIGGMAVVYRAEQVNLGRPVALKVLSAELSRDPVFRERFRREGKHVAALEHPNIIPIYDADEDDGRLYLATRLIDGETLARRMTDGGLSADQTMAILTPIADALDAAHAESVIHRDVKPQNILLTLRDHPFLADFGVAKSSRGHGLTASGSFLGSVSYASPEQIRGESLTSASDVYSLAAVLFQCLTGQVPYPRDTDASVMHAHLSEPPPSLPASAGRMQEVMARGMAKLPEHRHTSAGALLADAAEALDGLAERERHAVPAFPQHPQQARTVATAPGEFTIAVDATVHDRRRATPDVAAPPDERRRRPTVLAVAGVLVAATLAAGVVVLASSHGEQAARTAEAGPLKLTYGSGWSIKTLASTAVHRLQLRDALAVSGGDPADVVVTVGRLSSGGVQAGTLPEAAARAFATPPKARTVRLGNMSASQYEGRLSSGGAARVAVAPTSAGELVVWCSVKTAALSACARAVPDVRLVRGRSLAPGPDEALASGLTAALRPVIARAPGRQLQATDLAARAAGARRLSRADAGAAEAISALRPRSWDTEAVAALSAALRGEAHQLQALASAIDRRDRATYAHAASRVRSAGPAVQRRIGELRTLGYALDGPVVLAAAALPKRHHTQKSAPAASAPVTATAPQTQTQTPPAQAPVTHYTPPATSTPSTPKAKKKSDYGPVVVAPAQ